MNLLEILKNIPKGTKLYSPIFGEVTFVSCQHNRILVSRHDDIVDAFFYDGKYMNEGECVLFPSKENRDWNTFSICPFKDGDVISKTYSDGTKYIAIFSHIGGIKPEVVNYHCYVRVGGNLKVGEDYGIGIYTEFKFASVEDREYLFKSLLENGYCWDTCIKKVKPLHLKFKVGDTISKGHLEFKIISIEKDRYRMKNDFFLMFTDQHEWELAKFDIKELKPFDKVLVRYKDSGMWRCNFYSHYDYKGSLVFKYMCIDCGYSQCIPYNDDTKHLVGTNKECPEYYKTWE